MRLISDRRWSPRPCYQAAGRAFRTPHRLCYQAAERALSLVDRGQGGPDCCLVSATKRQSARYHEAQHVINFDGFQVSATRRQSARYHVAAAYAIRRVERLCYQAAERALSRGTTSSAMLMAMRRSLLPSGRARVITRHQPRSGAPSIAARLCYQAAERALSSASAVPRVSATKRQSARYHSTAARPTVDVSATKRQSARYHPRIAIEDIRRLIVSATKRQSARYHIVRAEPRMAPSCVSATKRQSARCHQRSAQQCFARTQSLLPSGRARVITSDPATASGHGIDVSATKRQSARYHATSAADWHVGSLCYQAAERALSPSSPTRAIAVASLLPSGRARVITCDHA